MIPATPVPAYSHIWDCCCDHGQLGMALLARRAAQRVHFVDLVPALMREVEANLQRFFGQLPENSWQVHCADVARLQLPAGGRQLVIIAGVGGDLLIELVAALLKAHPGQALEFILCPVRQHYQVRKALAELKLGLVAESLLQENKRFYEVIHVSTTAAQAISPVGSLMWDLQQAEHRDYLQRTLGHYQRMRQHGSGVAEVISAYQALLN